MKRLMMALVAAALMAGGVGTVQANEGCPMCAAHMDGDKKADKLALVLGLSDKQKDQVKQLVDAKKKKLEPAMEQMKTQMKAAKDEFDAGLKKILSADQQKKLEAWKGLEGDMKHGHDK